MFAFSHVYIHQNDNFPNSKKCSTVDSSLMNQACLTVAPFQVRISICFDLQ